MRAADNPLSLDSHRASTVRPVTFISAKHYDYVALHA
jgi:hypothetical protein